MTGPYPSGTTQPAQIMCPHCDRPNIAGMAVCGWCGKPLVGASAAQSAYPPPQQQYQGAQPAYPPPSDARVVYPGYGPQPYVAAGQPQKNLVLGFVLALIFGPLGLFYASVVGGVVMILVGIAAYALFFILVVGRLETYVPLFSDTGITWVTLVAMGIWAALVLASVVWAMASISAHNNKPQVSVAR